MTIIVTAKGTNASRDYDWLLDVVPRRLHRDDLGDDLRDFVMLAENRINGDLRAQLQDAVATLATTEGAQFIALPPSILSIKSLTIPGHGPIDYLAPAQFNTQYARDQGGGQPRHYTQIGSALYLGPAPQSVVTLSAVVRSTVPALADSAGTNWLIEQHPEVYLAATMCEALLHIRDYPNHQVWDGKYMTAIAALDNNDWENAGTLSLRAPT
ncbi:phage adaptor protein [Massilia timonae]|uniref:phage adaptor protein n=1 Tax=Massilia timonae TaxID=47229 RepID=UPI0028A29654|nr:hypothetical protein [Massilia timonae]